MRPYPAETVPTPYGETTFAYDQAGRPASRTNGDGTVRTQAYDAASQVTDLYDYTSVSQVAHFHYDYTPAGQVARMTQNGAVTTDYAYDGADQLISEAHAGDGASYSLGFGYDGDGNRLTQTSGGQPYQSFVYDAHDKLLSGNGGGETYSYDANGNQTGLGYYGSLYTFTWDDEDRLTGVTGPNGLNDSFAYNGLGQRVAKTDSTGQFALVSDGASPAAPVLADGLTVFTPGLSSRRGGASAFRHGDLLGSLRFETDANQNVTANRLYSAFGSTVASAGDPLMPFGWVGDGASQTDADTGLVLMGHRVYDSRLGRFLSQDPAGAGGNWYAYCGNNPINKTDPSGNVAQSVNGGSASIESAGYLAAENESFLSSLEQSLQPWLNRILAKEEVSMAKVLLYSPSDTAEILKDLGLIAGTDRGAEILAQAGLNGIGIVIANRGYVTPSLSSNPGYSNAGTGALGFSPDSMQYYLLPRADGFDTVTPLVSIAHELGHALTGTRDDGFYNMNNVNENENPIVTQLGISPRLNYDTAIILPNPYGMVPGVYSGKLFAPLWF